MSRRHNSPPPQKFMCSQRARGLTRHLLQQYCSRMASVNGISGNMSVTLLLLKVKLISVQT